MSERKVDFKVYLITDRQLFQSEDAFFEAVEGALKGGIKAVQLREKDLPAREFLALAYRMRALTMHYHAKFFINDRTDIALCAGADGVHLGQASMPVFAVRNIAGNRLLIGVSTHSLEEAHLAEDEGADFISFGPLYPTHSKLKYGAPVGLEALKTVTEEISIPVFGIGGIKRDTIKAVMRSGVGGIAVISGILGEDDTKAVAKEYIKAVHEQMSKGDEL